LDIRGSKKGNSWIGHKENVRRGENSKVGRKGREISRRLSVESQQLKMERRKRIGENSSALHVTNLDIMEGNVFTGKRGEKNTIRGSCVDKGSSG
jgi:hypothetical protein